MSENGELLDLTQSQLLIWTGQNLQPRDPLYNMVLLFRIDAAIDVECFHAAFERLVANCDTLRCSFDTVDGIPKQRFLDSPRTSLQYYDLSSESAPEYSLTEWVSLHKQVLFDIKDFQYESALFKLADDEYAWYLNQHHLITDAWAVSVIFETMQEYYRCAREDRLDDAPKLPAYEDYLAYEARQRRSRMHGKARTYWRNRLATPPPASRFYREVPERRQGRTVRCAFPIGASRSAAIRALADRPDFRSFTRDLSLFQIFCTVLFAYLHRVTGNAKLAIGTPAHNRVSKKLKQTVGLLIEIFPVMIEFDDDESFASLYGKVAETTREMLMNAPPGSSGAEHNRAYDVLLNYITASFGEFDGKPTRSQWIHADSGDRDHLLRLQVHDFDRSDEIQCFFDLNTEAFVGEERDWVGQHFACLLDAFLDDPQRLITHVALSPADCAPAAAAASDGESAADGKTVIDLFERRATASPDAIALSCAGQGLTYAELDHRAHGLAERLALRPGAAGARVAVAMRRSIDCVIAILGILKSGGTYVPIDPDYPAERIRYILADAKASLLIIDEWASRKLPATDVDRLEVGIADNLPQSSTGVSTELPQRGAAPAYIIYTSGSTGRPKGVVVGHRGLADYIDWAARFYDRGRALNFALFSSLSFDLTVTSLFTPLTTGGALIIYPEADDAGDIPLHRVIDDDLTDIAKLTPSHLSLLQSVKLQGSRIKTLIVGGEDLKVDLARRISGLFGNSVELYNEYGPTEGTVACMVHRFDPDRDTDLSVPIGRPIDHARILLLDEGGNPVPRGVRGQIFIGGSGVAEGYFEQAALTAARFIDEPGQPGRKLYATGDLGRWNRRGEMEFLGRADQQVKIRGYRVELGEIESELRSVDSISDCVVVARDRAKAADADGDDQYCERCGLSAMHPGAMLDEQAVCRICRDYEHKRESAKAYFSNMDELRELAGKMRAEATGEHHCLMLLSGGKDSTYALCRLVDLGLNPLVFTLDNGYISAGAKANIRRIVDQLGLDLVTGTTPAMNEIFVDSLKRFNNVCDGCFKTIYTLSMNLAVERGLRYICTGLSRGQIFETRVADLFHQKVFDPARIDSTIIEARKAYHRLDDVISRKLDVRIFEDDEVFERVQYVDFYRYCDATLDEMLDYLATRVPWVRPADTGRSTNCLINEAGIFVHKQQRGHHNYALPYSWDVRLGHKQRDAARKELDDDIDIRNVQRILDEIGYRSDSISFDEGGGKLLAAYYVAPQELPSDTLRQALARCLPAEFIPHSFTRLDALPLSPNGKVDRDALPEPTIDRHAAGKIFVEPLGETERALARIWSEILGVDSVGATDNFFDLGGESILNIQIVARARKSGIEITPQQIFDHPTIRELAEVVGRSQAAVADQGTITGPVELTPIQIRYFSNDPVDPDHFSQFVLLEIDGTVGVSDVEAAIARLLEQHDALRSRFEQRNGKWRQTICGTEEYRDPAVAFLQDERFFGPNRRAAAADLAARLSRSLKLREGSLVQSAVIGSETGAQRLLMIVIHHLVVDGVSWWIIMDDLQQSLNESADVITPRSNEKTTSVRQWSAALQQYARSEQADRAAAYWAAYRDKSPNLPRDPAAGIGGNTQRSARTLVVSLDSKRTEQLLHDVAANYRSQVPDALLAAFAPVLAKWSGGSEVQVDIEGHGREAAIPGVDLLRTVGWFTTIHPVNLHIEPGTENPGAQLKLIKEQLRGVPNRGFDYGVVRYLSDSPASSAIRELPRPQILFNYLGQWDRCLSESSKFGLVEPIALSVSPDAGRDYLLEINAMVFGGRLEIHWSWSEHLHERKTVETLARKSLAALGDLVDHCAMSDSNAFTPSDFPGADLSQSELDKLIAEFGE